MSGKLRNSKWDSSSDEEEDMEDTYDTRYRMKLRDSLRSQQSPVAENEPVVEPRRRGRGPSKRPCLNRNALMARENRLRKKAYVEKIENKLSFYQQENKKLADTIRSQGIDIKRLTNEVAYLRNVLNNNTSITALLKTINDGLKKIGTVQKKNSFQPNNCRYPDNSNEQHKCTCPINVKENALNSQNTNVFTIKNDHLTDQAMLETHSIDSYASTRKHSNCKIYNQKLALPSFLDTDHTYTIYQTPIVDFKNDLDIRETTNLITSTTSSISHASDDSYPDHPRELDSLMPITDLPNTVEKRNIDSIDADFDQLSTFNMDIFEDMPKCDEIMNTVDSLNDTTNLFIEEEMFQNLDNSGICLHVNSDKVSLEFCYVCHLNSKNSGSN